MSVKIKTGTKLKKYYMIGRIKNRAGTNREIAIAKILEMNKDNFLLNLRKPKSA
jgi:hypothetical protein